jgi:hypothetical protein
MQREVIVTDLGLLELQQKDQLVQEGLRRTTATPAVQLRFAGHETSARSIVTFTVAFRGSNMLLNVLLRR